MSTSRSDIDIDDPNFWQKWAKKAELDVDHLTKRVSFPSLQVLGLVPLWQVNRGFV